MTDLRTLTDAFAELERRADVASAAMPSGHPVSEPARQHLPRAALVPAAAAVTVVLGLVGAAALLAPDRDSGVPASGVPAGASQASGPADGRPMVTPAAPPRVPRTPEELAGRFRAVLGDTATFTVTDTGAPVVVVAPPSPGAGAGAPQVTPSPPKTVGAAIVGLLTASGVAGGFDLQIHPATPGSEARCDDPDPSRCTVRRLADGSSLAIGRTPLGGAPNGTTYLAHLVRPDGVEIVLHVSNAESPKGNSRVLAPQPPLTTEQLVAIVTSDRW